MQREMLVAAYLFVFKVLFALFKMMPLQRKVTFVVSYGDNATYIYEEMLRQGLQYQVVFLYKETCQYNLGAYPEAKAFPFETASPLNMLRAAYHLATASQVIVDNYFGFLAGVRFKKGVQCVQTWHAAGAVKKFGMMTPSFYRRSGKAQKRFRRVYANFHQIVVGSDLQGEIYKEAFGVEEHQLLKTGIPRADLFFDEKRKQDILSRLLKENPKLRGKRVILYAPTFRDKELKEFRLQLDMERMYQALHEDYILVMKLHPAIRHLMEYDRRYETFVYDYSQHPDINDLLLLTDILVTDYSSIPVEFSLLGKPMIFFAYDLQRYRKKRGIIGRYEDVPGPVVFHTEALIEAIRSNQFDYERIQRFAEDWNQYSNGRASEGFVEAMRRQLGGRHTGGLPPERP
ncbi:CDP-glycerol glycerophosphotransferase family protein [Ectobacillus ponti]|uniref:CDP-glycerol glycerophosphotransferase family protein n=1 Tax=Ectobacillus ponti TaxID=2961894 RepID=A0AA42BPX0_9BACI|nr:CDP-glycerol glycerophosphotransferase family protein [Ectobacillus ponti]MCP8967869.1 CDP-glycerol glycerophosphotransferase family protein [Ectobacillus ponti]